MARAWIIAGAAGVTVGVVSVFVWLGVWLWGGGVSPWLERLALDRRIAIGAASLPAPPPPDSWRMTIGYRHYAGECARCHSEPDGGREPWADGLNPQPPDLTQPGPARSVKELFWIICHGEPMSGMPSWRAHRSDDAIWDLALFVHALPTMSPGEYAQLRAQFGPAPQPLGMTPDATCYEHHK